MTAPAKGPFDRVRQIARIPTESQTDTSFGNDTDVNKIVARFARTGEIPEVGNQNFADVTGLQGDLTDLMEKTREARENLANLEEAAQKAKVEQAEKDAQDLARLREQEANMSSKATGSEENGTNS